MSPIREGDNFLDNFDIFLAPRLWLVYLPIFVNSDQMLLLLLVNLPFLRLEGLSGNGGGGTGELGFTLVHSTERWRNIRCKFNQHVVQFFFALVTFDPCYLDFEVFEHPSNPTNYLSSQDAMCVHGWLAAIKTTRIFQTKWNGFSQNNFSSTEKV